MLVNSCIFWKSLWHHSPPCCGLCQDYLNLPHSFQGEWEDTTTQFLLNVNPKQWCNSTVKEETREMFYSPLNERPSITRISFFISNSCVALDAKVSIAQISLVWENIAGRYLDLKHHSGYVQKVIFLTLYIMIRLHRQ